jgi:hypothetical protein
MVVLVMVVLAQTALAVTFIPLRGDVVITTAKNRLSGTVTVSTGGEIVAQFCLSFAQPLKRSIDIEAKGEVVYLPQPLEGLPPGAQSRGPEPIAQTLTVIPENGSPIAFVAKGVRPIVPNSEVVLIQNVVRRDPVASANGTSASPLEGCR